MARFSVCEGESSNNPSRKRQRLPSIDENEEDVDGGSSGEEEDEDEDEIPIRYRRRDSDDQESTSDCEVVIEKPVYSLTKDSPLAVTLLDSDVLDCPICCDPLKLPIFQCDNGHLACSVCCIKVRNRCPSCTLPIGYIRCRAMEKVIETSTVSCPNARYGCKENMLYGNRFAHDKLCVFTPCFCPMLNCNYIGSHKDLHKHVRAKHGDHLTPFTWNVGLSLSLDFDDETVILQEENDGEVMLVQVFKGLDVVYVSVSCIAHSAPEANNFSCSLINLTPDSILKHAFMVKIIQKVKNKQPQDGFMLIPIYMLSGSQNLNLQISIARGRDYVNS